MFTKVREIVLVTAVIGATLGVLSGSGGAGPFDHPWEAAGDITSASQVIGSTGQFELNNLSDKGGDINAAGDSITVNVKVDTRYFKEDTNGDYQTSSFEDVVVVGQRVFVSGRFVRNNGSYTFFANFVFNPPPPPFSPQPANPEPNLPRDAIISRVFNVKATVSEEGANLLPQCCWSEAWGHTLNTFTSFGGSDHVQAIVDHHVGSLRMYATPATRYWGNGDFASRDDVIEAGNQVSVNGRYSWDGTDWRFIAANVVEVTGDGTVGGPIQTTAEIARTGDGTFNSDSQTWENTQWDGETTSFDGVLTRATVHMDLDYFFNPVTANWEFTGSWEIDKNNSDNRVSGQISGTAATAFPFDVNANLTVDSGSGAWEGWTGSGTFEGNAQYLGTPSSAMPPMGKSGTFKLEIFSS